MMRGLIVLVLALIGSTCAVPWQSNRIVGGEYTTIEDYPFMAGILFNSGLGLIHYCGGTLVAQTAVVTAAHCVLSDLPSLWRVRLGSNLASSGGNVHTVSKVILHKEFDGGVTNDVAITRLAEPAVFSNQVKIARIAGPNYVLPDNTLLHVIGWGETKFEGTKSEVLQHVAVYTINHKLCTDRYAYLKTLPDMSHIPVVTPGMMCAGILDIGGKDACQGDSGGPVIHGSDVFVGITSWGHECAHPIYPGVNARVSYYSDWIYSNSL